VLCEIFEIDAIDFCLRVKMFPMQILQEFYMLTVSCASYFTY